LFRRAQVEGYNKRKRKPGVIAMLVPKRVFFTKGVGIHKEELTSFELALRDAGIEKFNLVQVSSIFPPAAKVISKTAGLKKLAPGQVVFCVMSKLSSNEPRRLLAASVGCAIPTDRKLYGYLSEHHAYGQTDTVAGDYAEDLAAAMLASTLGIDLDESLGWDEKKEIYRISDKIVKTTNMTQSAIVKSDGKYTTVVAAAVLIM
jgi:arginine decarboxylase